MHPGLCTCRPVHSAAEALCVLWRSAIRVSLYQRRCGLACPHHLSGRQHQQHWRCGQWWGAAAHPEAVVEPEQRRQQQHNARASQGGGWILACAKDPSLLGYARSAYACMTSSSSPGFGNLEPTDPHFTWVSPSCASSMAAASTDTMRNRLLCCSRAASFSCKGRSCVEGYKYTGNCCAESCQHLSTYSIVESGRVLGSTVPSQDMPQGLEDADPHCACYEPPAD